MKLSNIKTKTEFFEVADIWYQRAIRLMEITNDSNETLARKGKAAYLWMIMFTRMSKVSQIAIQISQPRAPAHFTDGTAIIGEGIEEVIKDRMGKTIAVAQINFKK
jgi:hypothetical protein